MTTFPLEEVLNNCFSELNISEDQQNSLLTYLELVKKRDIPTYKHSIRVASRGIKVAKFLHLNPKTLFYAGLLHDIGKVLSDPTSLKKTEGFNTKDMKELKRHPLDGYRILRGIHDFSAEILVRHHQFSQNGYPKQMPSSELDFSKGTQTMIDYFARILSIIDFFDAVSNRENDKFSPGNPKLPTRDEARNILCKSNPDQLYLIDELYQNGIF